MRRLAGKVALVTGAGKGIGAGIARRFAAEGAAVGVLDIRPDGCQAVLRQIEGAGGRALPLICDIGDEAAVNGAVAQIAQAFGPVTVLMNNAAVMPAGRLHETPPDAFDRCISVNLRGTYLVSRAVIPGMLAAGQGSIIHMASITALRGLPGLAVYAATKGALVALARAMSTDYARLGIRVNAISPGTIDSPMLHEFLAAQSHTDALRMAYDQMHPIGRVGTIDEVANVAVFLASDEASFVTGSNYEVDGGLSSKGEQPQDNPD
jgi:NAD(P)-dependent dehydrogenase (short-subunit alcohol dehydrogenase family)